MSDARPARRAGPAHRDVATSNEEAFTTPGSSPRRTRCRACATSLSGLADRDYDVISRLNRIIGRRTAAALAKAAMNHMPSLAVRAACDIADDNDRAAAAQEPAEGDFDKWLRGDDERGTVADYINDHASERIRILVVGPARQRSGAGTREARGAAVADGCRVVCGVADG